MHPFPLDAEVCIPPDAPREPILISVGHIHASHVSYHPVYYNYLPVVPVVHLAGEAREGYPQEGIYLHPGIAHLPEEGVRYVPTAYVVIEQPHLHPLPCLRHQHIAHRTADTVITEDVVLDMYVASRPAQVPQQGFKLRLPIGKCFEATAIEQRGTVVVAQQRRQRLVLRRQVAGILQDTLGVRPLHDAFVGTARDDALLAVVLPEEEVEQQPDTRRKKHRHHPRYRLQRVAVLGNDDYAQAQYRYHVEQKEDGTEYPLQTYQTEHLLLSYVL